MARSTFTPKVAPHLRAWDKLYEQDPRWAHAWNQYVSDHYLDPVHRERVRADGVMFAAHQAVVHATSVRAKRKAIRDYLTAYAPNYLPPRRRKPED